MSRQYARRSRPYNRYQAGGRLVPLIEIEETEEEVPRSYKREESITLRAGQIQTFNELLQQENAKLNARLESQSWSLKRMDKQLKERDLYIDLLEKKALRHGAGADNPSVATTPETDIYEPDEEYAKRERPRTRSQPRE